MTQRELDLGYCEEAQTYCSVAEERYQQGRADATKELPTSLYCDGFNDGYAKGKSDMLDKIIQAEKNKYYCVEDLCDESKNCSDCMVKYLEQMKEQKNG